MLHRIFSGRSLFSGWPELPRTVGKHYIDLKVVVIWNCPDLFYANREIGIVSAPVAEDRYKLVHDIVGELRAFSLGHKDLEPNQPRTGVHTVGAERLALSRIGVGTEANERECVVDVGFGCVIEHGLVTVSPKTTEPSADDLEIG